MMPALAPASEAEPSAHVDNSTVDERRHRAAALATGDPATLSQSDRHTRADGEVGVRIKPAVGAGRTEHSCSDAGSGPELQDPVVAVPRASPTVAVAGREP